jgi:hypothetical protein
MEIEMEIHELIPEGPWDDGSGPMPWCEHCQSYHHETADHIFKSVQTIDITPVGCQTPEDERIRRAIEIIDRANSRVASLATEMVETLARNEQYPSEKLDALKDAIQHRHRAYDSLYKAISGKG